jgi:hypothetical protein
LDNDRSRDEDRLPLTRREEIIKNEVITKERSKELKKEEKKAKKEKKLEEKASKDEKKKKDKEKTEDSSKLSADGIVLFFIYSLFFILLLFIIIYVLFDSLEKRATSSSHESMSPRANLKTSISFGGVFGSDESRLCGSDSQSDRSIKSEAKRGETRKEREKTAIELKRVDPVRKPTPMQNLELTNILTNPHMVALENFKFNSNRNLSDRRLERARANQGVEMKLEIESCPTDRSKEKDSTGAHPISASRRDEGSQEETKSGVSEVKSSEVSERETTTESSAHSSIGNSDATNAIILETLLTEPTLERVEYEIEKEAKTTELNPNIEQLPPSSARDESRGVKEGKIIEEVVDVKPETAENVVTRTASNGNEVVKSPEERSIHRERKSEKESPKKGELREEGVIKLILEKSEKVGDEIGRERKDSKMSRHAKAEKEKPKEVEKEKSKDIDQKLSKERSNKEKRKKHEPEDKDLKSPKRHEHKSHREKGAEKEEKTIAEELTPRKMEGGEKLATLPESSTGEGENERKKFKSAKKLKREKSHKRLNSDDSNMSDLSNDSILEKGKPILHRSKSRGEFEEVERQLNPMAWEEDAISTGEGTKHTSDSLLSSYESTEKEELEASFLKPLNGKLHKEKKSSSSFSRSKEKSKKEEKRTEVSEHELSLKEKIKSKLSLKEDSIHEKVDDSATDSIEVEKSREDKEEKSGRFSLFRKASKKSVLS